ncbi:MAG: hypothetical protein VXY89_16715, partial [SAR324 cluster bacterium]|nr:hypothetical protein [SAR324 cluster bacterium]
RPGQTGDQRAKRFNPTCKEKSPQRLGPPADAASRSVLPLRSGSVQTYTAGHFGHFLEAP